jgi:ribulose-phosphate 3-epimerase
MQTRARRGRMNILSPSILAADFSRLGKQIKEAEHAGAQYLHIDVMDGVFVPDISFGMPVISSIRKCTDIFFDVHLMIDRPERYVKEFADCGANLINFHLEATQDAIGTIQRIRFLGRKVGITISPQTPAKAVEPYLKLVDMVLVMTVKPGFGGQKLMPECLEKVKEVRSMVLEKGLRTDIEVDGGIRIDNVEQALQAGANVIVAGSAIFQSRISDNVGRFLEKMDASESAGSRTTR